VLDRLEDFLTPNKENEDIPSASLVNLPHFESLPHLEISTGQFLNFNYEEEINPYSLLDTPLQIQYKVTNNSNLELDSPKFQEEN